MNITKLWRGNDDDDRATLVIPEHDDLDHQDRQDKVQPVLQKAAQQILDSKLVWKWRKYTGQDKLVRWAGDRFVGDDIDGWRQWMGWVWKIKDTRGQGWLGPSRAVADRIIQAVLRHPDLPIANWTVESERRKAAK